MIMQKVKIYYPFIYIVLLMILASSCYNEISLKNESTTPKLVMNAFINADSTNNVLYLNLTGNSQLNHIDKAIVEVYVDNQLKEVASEVQTQSVYDKQKRYLITTKFTPGDKVKIEARTEDGKHRAWIEETVLQPPLPIEKVDTTTVKLRIYDSYYDRLRFRITFTDRSNETNFYRLILERTVTIKARLEENRDTVAFTKSYKMLCNEDIALTDGQPNVEESDFFDNPENIYGVFSDAYFKDENYTLNVYMQPNYSPYLPEPYEVIDVQQECLIRIQSISQNDFKYLKALNVLDSDVYDPIMMEPIIFASNVNGGLGLVSITTETTHRIELNEEHLYPY